MGAERRSKCCNTKIDLRKKGCSSINCIKQREITAISMTKIIVIWSWCGGTKSFKVLYEMQQYDLKKKEGT